MPGDPGMPGDSSFTFSYPRHRVHGCEVSSEETRPRIVGIETEYIVLYIASDSTAERPSFDIIEETIFQLLLRGRKSAASRLSKAGFFLENGGLVHMEIGLREQADTPILEMATPECRSAWDATVYSRAFDSMLEEVSRHSSRELMDRGYDGYISFGKNNRDSYRAGFGCHENYLIHQKPTFVARSILYAGVPFILLGLLPAALVFVALLVVTFSGLIFAEVFPRIGSWISAKWASLREHRRIWRQLVGFAHMGSCFLVLPGLLIYNWLLRATALRPFIRELAPFVATRSAIIGTGRLNFDAAVLETSQRAGMVRTFRDIVIFSRLKTMFDLKSFLYRPLSFFADQKKLVITCADSNLSDVSMILKTATTALLLEMIEDGARFAHLRIRNPVRALKAVSIGGPWKQLRLASGTEMSALEVQREYLECAKCHFADKSTGRSRHEETLRVWEHVLDQLEEQPDGAVDAIEWVAKRQILNEIIRPVGNWREFFAWGRAFGAGSVDHLRDTESLHHWLSRLSGKARRRARRALGDLEHSEFSIWKDVYLQARKIDLRFHELSSVGGYQRTLEQNGLMARITEDDDVLEATRRAPTDTRARVRGHYIQSCSPHAAATWSWVEPYPDRRIKIKDPFEHHLPGYPS